MKIPYPFDLFYVERLNNFFAIISNMIDFNHALLICKMAMAMLIIITNKLENIHRLKLTTS